MSPRRLSDVGTIYCDLTELEREVCDEMKAQAGLKSDADLIRTALWNFGDHLEIDMGRDAFDLRPRQGWKKPVVAS